MARISKDKGHEEGVAAQAKWGRDYAANAWPGVPVRVFADNNLSAASGAHRPEFEKFRTAVAAGEVAHVWAVEQSRLERREVEWFRLAAELDAAGITELHTNRDGIVRVRDEVAGIKAVLNAGEVRKLKKRVNDRLAENAALGQPPGGRTFGYARGVDADGNKTYVVVPEQAEAIRWAAEQVLAGWSLTNVAAKLTERGTTGVHGGRITATSVHSMLTNASIAGHRLHHGRIVGRGNWSAILTEDVWQAVRQRLSGSRVVRRRDGGTYPVTAAHTVSRPGRRYLLTGGLAECGVCHAPLLASMKQLRGGKSKPYYLCHPTTGGRGCIGILGDETERYVVGEMLDRLDQLDFIEQFAADNHTARRDELLAALAALDVKRGELADMWSLLPGDPAALTTTEWQTARRAQAEQEQALRAELAVVPASLVEVDFTAARSAWPDLPLDEKRAFIRLFVERVTVVRATPGLMAFDTDRVIIDWRKPNA